MKHFVLWWALWVALGSAVAQTTDLQAQRREAHLATELRCLVCQNQTIADSNADLAQDLRRQIREQIAAGKTDGEIIDYMTTRYGDFVLYRPPLKFTTVLLWFGPALIFAGAAVLVWRMKRARRGDVQALSPGERQRAAQLLSEE